jgi:hypothetical protein
MENHRPGRDGLLRRWLDGVDAAFDERRREELHGGEGLEYVATAGPKRIVDLKFSPAGDALYVVDIGPIHYARGAEGPKPMAFPGTGVTWRVSKSAEKPSDR